MNDASTGSEQRVAPLDGLRGVGALAVLLYHWASFTDVAGLGTVGRWVGRFLGAGWIGVDLFFALSGYLITTVLFERIDRERYCSAFFARRLLRIVPLYWVFLLLYVVVFPIVARDLGFGGPFLASLTGAGERQLLLWTYTANLWMAVHDQLIGGALEPVWSLCVELHFYLAWPFLLRLLGPRSMQKAMLGGLVVSWVLRLGLLAAGVAPRSIYFATPTHLDAVLAGSWVALAVKHGSFPRLLQLASRWTPWLVPCLLGATLAVRALEEQSPRLSWIGYSVIACCAALLVLHASSSGSASRLRSTLSWAPLRWVGQRSYALYLFHLPLIVGLYPWLQRELGAHWQASIATLLTTCPVLALLVTASWYLVEAPALSLRHLVPWGSAAPVSAPAPATVED